VRFKSTWYERKALKAMQQDQWDTAETYLRKLLEMHETNMGMQYNLGVCLLAQHKFEEAEGLFLANVEAYGESLRTCRILGDLYYEWGDAQKALEWYSKALEDDPDVKEKRLLNARIAVCRNPDTFKRAYTSFELARQARSMRKQNPQESLELYEKAAKADETHVEALNAAGELLLEYKKDPDQALRYFKKAEKLVYSPQLADKMRKAQRMKKK
jgi:tetratricopeptide (TPR) repeat protein